MRAVLILAITASIASATQISWTGLANDHEWTNYVNWNPAQVPASDDDVTINQGVVFCNDAAQVNSLTVGSNQNTANLTLYQQFIVGSGGLQVAANGNLIISSGLSQVFGTVTVAGSLTIADGNIGGSWTINSGAVADMSSPAAKGFVGAVVALQGTAYLGGLLVLNQSSTLTLGSPTTVQNNLIIQSLDQSQALFDASEASFTFAGQQLTVQAPVKFGPFSLTSGNVRILDALTFNNAITIGAGSTVAAFGAGTLTATNGITGAGSLTIATAGTSTIGGVDMTGAVNLFGGTCILQGSSSMSNLTIRGSQAVPIGTVTTKLLTLVSGTISGTSTISAVNVAVNTQGFVLASKLQVSGGLTMSGSTLTFGQNGALVLQEGSTATLQGTKSLITGQPYTPGITNNGVMTCTGAFESQNIPISGTGSITAQGTFHVSTASLVQATVTMSAAGTLSGQDTFLKIGTVKGPGSVKAVLGSYALTCDTSCTGVATPNMMTPPGSNFTFQA